MYCVIIATHVSYRNGGYCYDIMSCNSLESAKNKLLTYHNSQCKGNLMCGNCFFNDNEYRETMKGESDCRKYCKKCVKCDERQEEYCSKCKYCENCSGCIMKKCDQCNLYCDACDFKYDNLENFIISEDDNDGDYVRVKIHMLESEFEKYGVYV